MVDKLLLESTKHYRITINGVTHNAHVQEEWQGLRLVLIETDDTDVTGSFNALVTSFKGSSNTHPYEALTFSGNASAWTSTAGGSKTAIKLVLTVDSSGEDATGGSQTVTFAYAVPTEVSVDAAGGDGLFQLSCSFTDHENRPTLA